MNRPWVILAAGCALVGGAAGAAFLAAADWYPHRGDPVALGGGFGVGVVAGLVFAALLAHLADSSAQVDRHVARHRDPEELDLGGVLRFARVECQGPVGTGTLDVADSVGVTRDGAW